MRETGIAPLVLIVLSGCGGAPPTTETPAAALSYYKDVKPIIESRCNGCHFDGGIAPLSLGTYEAVNTQRYAIRATVVARTMPPWPPSRGCRDYEGARGLSDAQIETIADWVDQGGLAGNAADYVAPPPVTAGLARTDLELKLPLFYTPRTQPDEYRCFLLDWPAQTEKYVTGFEGKPGNGRIVHHLIAFLAPPDQVSSFQKLDEADPEPGYPCYGGPGGPVGKSAWLGAWVPGAGAERNAPDSGVKVLPGSKVILQVHYNSMGTPSPDQTAIHFTLEDKVAKEAFILPFANPDWIMKHTMNIPAGSADAMHEFSFDLGLYTQFVTNGVLKAGQPLTMYAGALHMHTRGRHGHLNLERASGDEECLLDIADWDFHWQGSYGFAKPAQAMPGDKLHIECHWDNSAGNQPPVNGQPTAPVDLNWGEGTNDEMCLGVVYVTR